MFCRIHVLQWDGYRSVSIVGSGEEAIQFVKKQHIDLAIVDIWMTPTMDGFELMEQLREFDSDIEFIVISGTANEGLDFPLRAGGLGVKKFFPKPFDLDEASSFINHLIFNKLAHNHSKELHFDYLIGESLPMKKVYNLIKKVAKSDNPVLITGESGTGKELVAQAIHQASHRKYKPFVEVNCAAIPKGLIESELFGHVKGAFTGANSDKSGKLEDANGGTLFLDEIVLLPQDMQAKLLRVLQPDKDGKFLVTRLGSQQQIACDFRLITATNEDIQCQVANQRFREDLYYRIRGTTIELPPLHSRGQDILLLINYLLKKFNNAYHVHKTFSEQALQYLQNYAWPGNVRDLQQVIEKLVSTVDLNTIKPRHLPEEITKLQVQQRLSLKEMLRKVEIQYIKEVLTQTHGNQAQAARLLQITTKSLWAKLKRLNITQEEDHEPHPQITHFTNQTQLRVI